ncbi:hypothetical protein BU15DRAFT_63588 [Melanogaster broomeanus]|nr:hypothetical protein BU15DRAFT_63588 [Melanogaster broomeanus]
MSKMDPACPVFDHAGAFLVTRCAFSVPLTLPTCYPTVLPTHPSPLPSYPPIFNPVGVLSVALTVLACLRPHRPTHPLSQPVTSKTGPVNEPQTAPLPQMHRPHLPALQMYHVHLKHATSNVLGRGWYTRGHTLDGCTRGQTHTRSAGMGISWGVGGGTTTPQAALLGGISGLTDGFSL